MVTTTVTCFDWQNKSFTKTKIDEKKIFFPNINHKSFYLIYGNFLVVVLRSLRVWGYMPPFKFKISLFWSVWNNIENTGHAFSCDFYKKYTVYMHCISHVSYLTNETELSARNIACDNGSDVRELNGCYFL